MDILDLIQHLYIENLSHISKPTWTKPSKQTDRPGKDCSKQSSN